MIKKAREFAVLAHGDQRYGDKPYSFHLDAVAANARAHGELAEVIAYLHDVAEDTAVEIADIEKNFGAFIAQCVDILTDGPGETRIERKRLAYAKMSAAEGRHELALVVKAADRLANIRACVDNQHHKKLTMYALEHQVFRDAAYRKGLCDDLWHAMAETLSQYSDLTKIQAS